MTTRARTPHGGRCGRRGLTLLEIVAALAITGVIALATYAALDAGVATRQRIDGPLRDAERALLARTLLEDALRHASESGERAQPFASRAAALDFETRGIEQPLGGSPRWRVQVRADGMAMVVEAASMEQEATPLRLVLPGVRAVHGYALGAQGWTDAPDALARVPATVRVEFVAAAGATPLPPIVTRTLESGPR